MYPVEDKEKPCARIARLEEENARLSAMTTELGEGVVITDLESRIQHANPAFATMMGYRLEELIGKRGYELFLPAEQWPSILSENIDRGKGKPGKYEIRLTRKDGSRFWVSIHATPYTCQTGQVIGTLAIFTDIDQRKQMEENQALILEISTMPFSADFFSEVTRKLCVAFEVTAAFVTECYENPETVRTIAHWQDGEKRESRTYALAGTACETVVGREPVLFPSGVGRRFPRDRNLLEDGIDSFVGVPLDDSACKPLGHVALMHKEPFPNRSELIETLETIGSRLASEIERNRKEAQLEEKNRLLRQEVTARKRADSTVDYLRGEIGETYDVDTMIGESKVFRDVIETLRLVADTEVPVLITGETGTGKELVARRVHALSRRASAPMIKVNCAALPRELIEAELFGHEKGAFTSAQTQRKGRFELADGGTLFLDEIGELPLPAQAKLLRVLQEKEIERVGSSKSIKVDFRLIAATNRNLAEMVAAGDFRDDLFYRLEVFPVRLPPLRERSEDIAPLAEHFLSKIARALGKEFTGIASDSLAVLRAHDWPGNIRELENLIHRSAILAPGPLLEIACFSRPTIHTDETLDNMMRHHIQSVLTRAGWRVEGEGGAAAVLGLNPSTLRSKMRKLGIAKSE